MAYEFFNEIFEPDCLQKVFAHDTDIEEKINGTRPTLKISAGEI